jgi:hypothetical protein
LNCDAFSQDRWEVMECCEDGLLEFLCHVSTFLVACLEKVGTYAASGCQLETEVRCHIWLGMLDDNCPGAIFQRGHEDSAVYKIRCTA